MTLSSPGQNRPLRAPPSRTRKVEIAEALYARVRGQIWVPPGDEAHAPFSGELVAFCESTVVRLYDEWVTRPYML